MAVVRALGRAGHDVVVCSSTPDPLAGASRYCRRVYHVPEPDTEPEAFQSAVLEAARESGARLVLTEAGRLGGLGHGERLDRAVERDAEGCLAHGFSTVRSYGSAGEVMGDELRVFVHAHASPAQMVIFGAIDFSTAVAAYAKPLGYPKNREDTAKRRTSGRWGRVLDLCEWAVDDDKTTKLGFWLNRKLTDSFIRARLAEMAERLG